MSLAAILPIYQLLLLNLVLVFLQEILVTKPQLLVGYMRTSIFFVYAVKETAPIKAVYSGVVSLQAICLICFVSHQAKRPRISGY